MRNFRGQLHLLTYRPSHTALLCTCPNSANRRVLGRSNSESAAPPEAAQAQE
eukprot:m.863287 g.863287  ORF g.863287 m.863287 type:complete len:52 (-) comp59699_c0_seq1:213-368(-)